MNHGIRGVTMQVIRHQDQRYPTVGDWWIKDETLVVAVSRMGSWRYELLVAVHEIVEAVLCVHNGVSDAAVTEFDERFEAVRELIREQSPGAELLREDPIYETLRLNPEAEPGDCITAPYRREHCFATAVERMLAAALGVDWSAYEAAILELD